MSHRDVAAAAGLAALAAWAATRSAEASERHFTYAYESLVLDPGSVEIEPWSTYSFGRRRFYSRFDQRLEFEVGVAPRLQASIYWNFSAKTQDQGTVRHSETHFDGISSEWKYKLSDPVADALGSAVYVEGSAGSDSAEIEAKVIVDKRLGPVLIAVNAAGDHEWRWSAPGGAARQAAAELVGGAGYFASPNLFAGLELWNVNPFEDADRLDSSVLYAGPTLTVLEERWWTALTFMPQVAAFSGKTAGSALDLTHRERLQTRLVFGLTL